MYLENLERQYKFTSILTFVIIIFILKFKYLPKEVVYKFYTTMSYGERNVKNGDVMFWLLISILKQSIKKQIFLYVMYLKHTNHISSSRYNYIHTY